MQSTVQDPGLSLPQIAAMVGSRKALLVVVTLVTVLVSALAAVLLPKVYVAKAEVYIEYRGNDPILGRQFSAMQDDSYLATQIDILKSDDVAQYVIDRTRWLEKPDVKKEVDSKGVHVVKLGLMKSLGENLTVLPHRNSRVLEMTYEATDPAFARDVLNAVIKGYMEITNRIHTEPAKLRREQYSGQLVALQEEVDRLQAEITAYQQREGILDTDERLDSSTRLFGELQTRLLAVQASLSEASTRKMAVKNMLSRGGSAADIPEVARHEGVRDLRLRLIEVEGRLVEAAGVLGPNHPRYKSLLSDRDGLRQQLERAANSAMQAIEEEERRFAEQARSLQREIAARQQQLLETKKHRDAIGSLQRQLASAQQVYTAAIARYDEILMQSNINSPNVAVLQWAERPARHARPSLTKNLMVGLPGGLMLGLVLALFLELSFRRVRCAQDVASGLPVPLLGVA